MSTELKRETELDKNSGTPESLRLPLSWCYANVIQVYWDASRPNACQIHALKAT